MFGLIVIGVVFALLVGLTIKRVTDWVQSEYEISWAEFAVGSVICSLVVVPLVVFAGWKIAIGNMVEYNEFWNGWETAAAVDETVCEKNGSCTWTYQCDPYEHTHSTTSTDANGNTTTSYYTETHWNDCPYMTREFQYTIRTTLGDYDIGPPRFSDVPVLWQGVGSGDRGGIPNVGQGPPALWTAASERIAAGDNGPVTKHAKYDNFLLASQSTILQQYSDSIKEYRRKKLLPKLDKDISSYYYANKVQFAGLDEDNFPNWEAWEMGMMRLDAALGTDLQGDMRIVFVPDELPADNYTLTLQAYWGSPALGKWALSKNGIVLVVGTDGKTAVWARAFTGMPVGNNAMLKELQSSIQGQPLDPELWLGHPRVDLSRDKPSVVHSAGIFKGKALVESVLWGPNKFQRVCMGCEGKGDTGVGYLYLKDELQPGKGAKFLTAGIAVLLSLLVWGAALGLGTRSTLTHRRGRSSYW